MTRQEVDVIEVGGRAFHYGDFENAGSLPMLLELLRGTGNTGAHIAWHRAGHDH